MIEKYGTDFTKNYCRREIWSWEWAKFLSPTKKGLYPFHQIVLGINKNRIRSTRLGYKGNMIEIFM